VPHVGPPRAPYHGRERAAPPSGPTAAPLPVCRTTAESTPSSCRHRQGTPLFKAIRSPSRAPCRAARHGSYHHRALASCHFQSHPTTRAPSLGLPGAPSATGWPARAPLSPEPRSPRPPPLGIAMRRRRLPLRPNAKHKPAEG
jgi:hypothetical protein